MKTQEQYKERESKSKDIIRQKEETILHYISAPLPPVRHTQSIFSESCTIAYKIHSYPLVAIKTYPSVTISNVVNMIFTLDVLI